AGSVANALAPVFAQLGAQARMLELGGGTGAFAGSLFAGSVANALAPVFAQLGAQARMLELGGGTGAFA
ncbi:hypothetical protein C7E18_24390, partial [Stenotrophomonas maltophilia]